MVKRLGALLAVALLAVFVLAACGSEDDGPEPTVTRIPDEEVANLPVAGRDTAARR